MKYYVIIEDITQDQFYDIAFIRVGQMDDQTGVLLSLPIPHGLNHEWVDKLINNELNKILEYMDGKTTQETKKENG